MEKRIAVVAPPQKSERLRSNNTPAENESWKMVPWLRPNPRIIQIVLFHAPTLLCFVHLIGGKSSGAANPHGNHVPEPNQRHLNQLIRCGAVSQGAPPPVHQPPATHPRPEFHAARPSVRPVASCALRDTSTKINRSGNHRLVGTLEL